MNRRAPIGQDHAGTWRSAVTYQGRRWLVLADDGRDWVVLRLEGTSPTVENTKRIPRSHVVTQLDGPGIGATRKRTK